MIKGASQKQIYFPFVCKIMVYEFIVITRYECRACVRSIGFYVKDQIDHTADLRDSLKLEDALSACFHTKSNGIVHVRRIATLGIYPFLNKILIHVVNTQIKISNRACMVICKR